VAVDQEGNTSPVSNIVEIVAPPVESTITDLDKYGNIMTSLSTYLSSPPLAKFLSKNVYQKFHFLYLVKVTKYQIFPYY